MSKSQKSEIRKSKINVYCIYSPLHCVCQTASQMPHTAAEANMKDECCCVGMKMSRKTMSPMCIIHAMPTITSLGMCRAAIPTPSELTTLVAPSVIIMYPMYSIPNGHVTNDWNINIRYELCQWFSTYVLRAKNGPRAPQKSSVSGPSSKSCLLLKTA